MITVQEARKKAVNSVKSKNEILDFINNRINEAAEKGYFNFIANFKQITEEQTIEVSKVITNKGFNVSISFEKTGILLGNGKIEISWRI